MSSKSSKSKTKKVHTKEEDMEGHEPASVKKHLTMKYNMKELRKFTEFELWATENLEDLIPDESKRPIIEATELAGFSDDKKIKALQKMLKPGLRDEEKRDGFIEEYLERFQTLPLHLLEDLEDDE